MSGQKIIDGLQEAIAAERQVVEDTLDAAHEYLVATYGHSPLAHPVDRDRVAAIRSGAIGRATTQQACRDALAAYRAAKEPRI